MTMNIKNTIITLFILSSCSPNYVTKDFFCARSYDEIADANSGDYEFQEGEIDYNFPELGTVAIPVTKLRVNNNFKQKYKVVIIGKNTFAMDRDSIWNTEHVDSVYCTGIAIIPEHGANVLFLQKDSVTKVKSPLPNKVLEELREDFFIMNKNKRYNLKRMRRGENYISSSYPYKL